MENLTLVPLRDRDDDGDRPFSTPGQGRLLADAIVLANTGATCEQIMATLQERYPGLSDNHYGNPAAEACMRRLNVERARRDAIEVDKRRLRAKGLPESLAEKGEKDDDDAPESRPDYTDDDTGTWRGPLHVDVIACKTVPDLLELCARFDLRITLDPDGEHLKLSRKIATDSALVDMLRKRKQKVLAYLRNATSTLDDDA